MDRWLFIILRPSLSSHLSGSFGILKHLLDGPLKVVASISLNIIDVRDVADLHIRAMETLLQKDSAL